MKAVKVAKLIRVEKPDGFAGSLSATATPKMVIVDLVVTAIPEGGGTLRLHLPWGKIYGVARNANPAKKKANA